MTSAAMLSKIEQELLDSGVRYLAGVDEVGRGCLAGPVVAASVIYPKDTPFPKVFDSKILTPSSRERLFPQICGNAVAYATAMVGPDEIDRINIHQASLLAMRLAVESLPVSPDFLLVDGKFSLDLDIPQRAITGGDSRCQVIAAASIVAKVWRDRLMCEKAGEYPGYRFERHKGYATRLHREAIRRLGPTPLHRRSFRGVAT